MRRLAAFATVSAGVLVASSLVPSAYGAARLPVELVADQSFTGGLNTFTLNVPECPSGTTTDLRTMVRLTPAPGVFHGIRRFDCAAGAGSVTVSVSARFGPGGSVGTWSVVASQGVLAGAHGSGKLVGTPIPDGIRDTYTGTVTLTG